MSRKSTTSARSKTPNKVFTDPSIILPQKTSPLTGGSAIKLSNQETNRNIRKITTKSKKVAQIPQTEPNEEGKSEENHWEDVDNRPVEVKSRKKIV